MDSDLDNIIESGGAKRSKRPRAGSRKVDRPTKVPRRSEKTPPPAPPVTSFVAVMTSQVGAPPGAPTSQVGASVVALTSQVGASTMAEPQLPVAVQPSLGPPPKKPSASRAHKLSVSTHVEEYVIDNAAGTHGSMLCSDVMSRIGQSFSSLEAPQWQVLNNA